MAEKEEKENGESNGDIMPDRSLLQTIPLHLQIPDHLLLNLQCKIDFRNPLPLEFSQLKLLLPGMKALLEFRFHSETLGQHFLIPSQLFPIELNQISFSVVLKLDVAGFYTDFFRFFLQS